MVTKKTYIYRQSKNGWQFLQSIDVPCDLVLNFFTLSTKRARVLQKYTTLQHAKGSFELVTS